MAAGGRAATGGSAASAPAKRRLAIEEIDEDIDFAGEDDGDLPTGGMAAKTSGRSAASAKGASAASAPAKRRRPVTALDDDDDVAGNDEGEELSESGHPSQDEGRYSSGEDDDDDAGAGSIAAKKEKQRAQAKERQRKYRQRQAAGSAGAGSAAAPAKGGRRGAQKADGSEGSLSHMWPPSSSIKLVWAAGVVAVVRDRMRSDERERARSKRAVSPVVSSAATTATSALAASGPVRSASTGERAIASYMHLGDSQMLAGVASAESASAVSAESASAVSVSVPGREPLRDLDGIVIPDDLERAVLTIIRRGPRLKFVEWVLSLCDILAQSAHAGFPLQVALGSVSSGERVAATPDDIEKKLKALKDANAVSSDLCYCTSSTSCATAAVLLPVVLLPTQ